MHGITHIKGYLFFTFPEYQLVAAQGLQMQVLQAMFTFVFT